MTEISNTGERILLEKESPLMIARHFAAYRLAGNYAIGKAVLEIGCGEGYGSYYLSDYARIVKALDYDAGIITYAKEKYRRANLNFSVLTAERILELKETFDIICSFQCIEHIKDADSFLEAIKSLMNTGGVFLCSTPNIKDASPGSNIPFNRFHIREYLYGQFRKIMGAHFKNVSIFCVKRGGKLNFYRGLKKAGIFNFLPSALNPVKRFYQGIKSSDFIITENDPETALDFIAVCKKE